MNTLKKYLKPEVKLIILALSMKISNALLELLLPYITSHIIDVVVPTKSVRNIIIWTVTMIVCAFAAWRLGLNANRRASLVARNVTENIRHDLFDKTIYLSSEKTDEFTIPSLEGRLTTDTYNVHRMIGMMMRMGIRGPIILVGGLVITFIMEPVLSLVLLATIPFISVLVYFRTAKGVPMFRAIHKKNDRMVGVVRENAQGIRVIKALSKTAYERERYRKVNGELRDATVTAQKRMSIINPSMNFILNTGMAAVILVGAYRVSAGLSAAGKIIAFMSYFTIISRSVMQIGRMFLMLSQGLASADRIEEVLTCESEKDWKPAEYPAGNPAYALEFRDVTFSYLKVMDNLTDISFKLKKGQTLGVIGATGSGKSTILALLLHFYNTDRGQIFLNGKDIRSWAPSELRSKFGVVMQNDFLFRDTLDENIRFGRTVTDEAVEKAIETAQAKEFIEQIDEGMQYQLTGKGQNLSGGQRQRVLLSRAFAAEPDFLMLDDSSSALDYNTDAKLRKAIAEAYPDATKIIVAQRVSSVMNCDEILMLDGGKILASGKHDELMAGCELYASIYESQMGGALFD